MKRVLCILLLLWPSCVMAQSNLLTLVNSLATKHFGKLNAEGTHGWTVDLVDGINNGANCTAVTGTLLSFASKGVYNPSTDEVYFTGGSHSAAGTGFCLAESIKYNVAGDLWTNLGAIAGTDDTHTYDSNAIIPEYGKWYWNHFTAAGAIFAQNIPDGSNGTVATPPTACASVPDEPSLEYFPDRNELLYLQSNALCAYLYQRNTWTTVTTTALSGLGNRNPVMLYDPVRRVTWIMGGGTVPTFSQAMYKYDASGTITRIADMPSAIRIWTECAIATRDPVSGNLVVLTTDATDCASGTGNIGMWEFNGGTQTWTNITSSVTIPTDMSPQLQSIAGVIAIPMSRYGVIMFAGGPTAHNGAGNVYIYKHSNPNSFANLCAAPGVVRCFNFDTSAQLGTVGPPAVGQNFGSFNNSGNCNQTVNGQLLLCPTIDLTVSASGAGSLKFITPSQSGQGGSGSWFTNFSPDLTTQFGNTGDEFWVQWRQRFDSTYLSTTYWGIQAGTCTLTLSSSAVGAGRTATLSACGSDSFTGMVGHNIAETTFDLTKGYATITSVTNSTTATVTVNVAFSATTYTAGNWANDFVIGQGWKTASLTTGDTSTVIYASCTSIDMPTQNTQQRSMAQLYNSCTGSFSHGPFDPMYTTGANPDLGGASDIFLQPGMPNNFCSYNRVIGSGAPANSENPPTGNCIPFTANEWMTFREHIKLGTKTLQPDGTYEWVNSKIDMWVGHEGAPTVQTFNQFTYNLTAAGLGYANDSVPPGTGTQNQAFGKIYLLPYHTNKSVFQVTAQGNEWYDDLIISSQAIADPTANGSSSTPTTSPVVFRAGSGKTIRAGSGATFRTGVQ